MSDPINPPARVCIIDDDIYVLDALAVGLRDVGFDVVVAPGAAAGLDFVMRNGADAIVTDMNMPGTGGAELISEARAAWPSMPIIAMSGSSVIEGRAIADVARERGANAVLLKPLRVAELKPLLDRLIGERA